MPAPLARTGSQVGGAAVSLGGRRGVNALPYCGYNPSVTPLKAKRRASSPYTGELRIALRQRSAHLHLSAHRSRALSLPQSSCLNPERSPTAPSSEGAEAAAAARHRFSLSGSQAPAARFSPAVALFPLKSASAGKAAEALFIIFAVNSQNHGLHLPQGV